MHRVKHIEYDEDDLYDDEEEGENYGQEEGDAQDGLTAEDRENFATLTPVVRADLERAGLSVSDKEIQDALWHYYWDVDNSVAYLKSTKVPNKQQNSQSKQDSKSKKEKSKSRFDQAAEKSAAQKGNGKPAHSTSSLVRKTETLRLDAGAVQSPQPNIKSKGIDVPSLWAYQASQAKRSVAFVVIGHVDHGKSTLMGRLLLDTGAVAQRDVDKFKKQATEMGKSSFALAWVMDTGSEERERGVTVDIAQHHFSTDNVDFTILDAPGHRDFVPNMIGGASMADAAVLVVDSTQLESGMKGQTREHVVLARACGIERIIVAVNKLDLTNPAWSQNSFEKVRGEITKLLQEAGFWEDNISFVPCSGLGGQNVVQSSSATGKTAWIAQSYPTLLQALEESPAQKISQAQVKDPLRMQITDVYRGGITNPLSVSGRIRSGNVQIGDSVVIQPSGETATIRGIDVGDDTREWAVAGQLCSLHLTDIDPQHLRSGDVLCSATKPVVVSESFTCRVEAIEALLPYGVDVHNGRLHVPGNISQLVALVDAKGDVLRKRLRVVKAGQNALVKISLTAGIPVSIGDRVVLRVSGTTVAAGKVEGTDA